MFLGIFVCGFGKLQLSWWYFLGIFVCGFGELACFAEKKHGMRRVRTLVMPQNEL
jgi:hypothetical protein